MAVDKKLIAKKFGTVTEFPGFVGLSDFASTNQDGIVVETPNFPFCIVFHPLPSTSEKFKNSIPSNQQYVVPPVENIFTTAFQGNETLYEIYGITQPSFHPIQGDIHLLGRIVLTSPFVESTYSDKNLFFGHTIFEHDLKWKPSWREMMGTGPNFQSFVASEGAEKYQNLLHGKQLSKGEGE
jgi:hypothetical protein